MLIFSKLQIAHVVFFHQTPEICSKLKDNSDYGLLCLITVAIARYGNEEIEVIAIVCNELPMLTRATQVQIDIA